MGKKLFLAAVAAGALCAANAVVDIAIRRKPTSVLTIEPTPEHEAADAWFKARAVAVRHRNREDMRLAAWFVPKAGSRDYAILCHGYTSCGADMRFQGKSFYDMGMNVLMPDARAHGKSAGKMIGMGWPERLDIVEWVYEILKRDADASILLYGVSMGAATVMMAAGEALPENVKLVIEDCGYTSVREEIGHVVRMQYKLPSFPLVDLASLVAQYRAGYGFSEASAVDQIQKCRVPVLFIHGEKDDFVPFEMVFPLYGAATCEKQLLTVPDAGHANAMSQAPQLYWDTIRDFVQKHMHGAAERESTT